MGTNRRTTPQSITVEYTVTGSLDGTTPAPEVNIDQGSEDPTPFDRDNQIYRPDPVESLGLIDPDLLLGGSIGVRCIPFLTLDAPGAVGGPDASLDVVAVRLGTDGEVLLQRQIRDWSAVAGSDYVDEGFNVPQGSDLRLRGFAAVDEPLRVRVSMLVPDSCLGIASFKPNGPVVPVCKSVLLVRSLADLPAPVNGVIQLPGDTQVKPCGFVDLEGNVLRYGDNTTVQGNSALLDGFITDSPDPLLSAAGGFAMFMGDVRLQNPGGACFDYDGQGGGGGGGVFLCIDVMCLNSARGGTVIDTPFASLQNVLFLQLADGIVFDGEVAFVNIVTCALTDPSAPGFTAVSIPATASIFTLNVTDNDFIFNDPGQVGLALDPAAGYSLGALVSNNTFTPPGTPLTGVTKGTPPFRFLANIGILDSINLGNMAFTGNLGGVTTTFPGVGAFVRVGNGNPGTHPLFVANPNNERFSLVGATAPTQELSYDGTAPKEMCIRGSMSVQNPALTAQGFAVRLLQNGAPIANATLEGQTGGLVTSAGSLMVEAVVTAAPGDLFTLEIANLTSAAPLVVSSSTFTVGGA